MNSFKNVCVVLVLVAVAWTAANWNLVKNAWKYRANLADAKGVADFLSNLGS